MSSALHSFDPHGLPAGVRDAVWHADEMGSMEGGCVLTGFPSLDAALPGGGWPTQSLTEILAPQAPLCEWRLLAGALPALVEDGGQILMVAPPQQPHAAGLAQRGIPPERLVWIQAKTPAERLWATEQLLKSNHRGAVLAWLPQARADQIRRRQVHAQSCESPVFLFRPIAAEREASPAPLRLQVSLGKGWDVNVRVLKRRGTPFTDMLSLQAIPGPLSKVLPPRLHRLGTEIVVPLHREEATRARDLGRTAPPQDQRILDRH